jgi:hypothetical protein
MIANSNQSSSFLRPVKYYLGLRTPGVTVNPVSVFSSTSDKLVVYRDQNKRALFTHKKKSAVANT